MYYRIFDCESESHITALSNLESKTAIKKEMEPLLSESLSSQDVKDLSSLSWDGYVDKLKEVGYLVESQPMPFEVGDILSLDDWMDLEDYEDDDYYNIY